MNPHFERAQLLFHQSRYDLAEESLRRSLADDPDFSMAHGLLALCMLQREAYKDATDEAQRGVALAPDMPFMHYVLANVYLQRNRLEDAEQAAKTAVELNPYDADLHYARGSVYMAQRRWTAALDAADEGLRLDAEHTNSANLRASALVKLGRKSEAERVMVGVLARDPEDAFSHANQGWTALYQSEPKKALEHFREALRLDPTMEFAQAGMVEALKARYLIYRLMLRWFLFMGRLSRKTQWFIIIGLVLFNQILGSIQDNNPRLAPYIWPVLGTLIAFVVMTWVASPLFNLMLRLNRYGRYAISREQRIESNWVGLFFLAAIVALTYGLVEDHYTGMFLAINFGFMVLVISGVFKAPWGRPRFVLGVAAIGLFGLGQYAVWLRDSAIGMRLVLAKSIQDQADELMTAFIIGCAAFSFVANILMSIRRER